VKFNQPWENFQGLIKMSLKTYLIFIIFSLLLSWGAWFLVVFNINPESATFFVFVLFYLSLFFALVGTFSLFGFLMRYFFHHSVFPADQMIASGRQSIWFALIIVGTLLLQSQRLVTWWNLLLLVILFSLVEFYFQNHYQNSEESEKNKTEKSIPENLSSNLTKS